MFERHSCTQLSSSTFEKIRVGEKSWNIKNVEYKSNFTVTLKVRVQLLGIMFFHLKLCSYAVYCLSICV